MCSIAAYPPWELGLDEVRLDCLLLQVGIPVPTMAGFDFILSMEVVKRCLGDVDTSTKQVNMSVSEFGLTSLWTILQLCQGVPA